MAENKRPEQEDSIRIEIKVTGLDPELLRALKESLTPEILSQPDRKRGQVNIEGSGDTLVISISSSNASGARALFNAYIYLLNSALQTISGSR